jgi:hypothetical protein
MSWQPTGPARACQSCLINRDASAKPAERAKNMDRPMKRITFEIDDDVLALVERYARAANTSSERILKDHLTMIAEQNDIERQRQARKELLHLMEQFPLELGNWRWNREELYDRRALSGVRVQNPFHEMNDR